MRRLYILLMVSLFSFGRVDVWYSFRAVQYRGVLFGIVIYNYDVNYMSTSLRHLQYFIILPIFMYSYNKIGDRRVILKDFAMILLMAILLNGIYTFLQYLALLKITDFHQFYPIRITRSGEEVAVGRAYGFFGEFSALGIFSSIVAIYFVCLEFYKKKVKLKFPSIYSITAIILALFCLLVSGHRASIVGLFIVLTLFFVFNIRHTIAVLRKVGLVVCIFTVFLVSLSLHQS